MGNVSVQIYGRRNVTTNSCSIVSSYHKRELCCHAWQTIHKTFFKPSSYRRKWMEFESRSLFTYLCLHLMLQLSWSNVDAKKAAKANVAVVKMPYLVHLCAGVMDIIVTVCKKMHMTNFMKGKMKKIMNKFILVHFHVIICIFIIMVWVVLQLNFRWDIKNISHDFFVI